MRPLIFVIALFLATAAAAQSTSTSPILIPIFYSGPGANDSHWLTWVQITNRGSEHLQGRGITFVHRTGCPIPEGCEMDRAPRGEFSELYEPQSVEGLLLHPSAADADRIDVQAQFAEERHRPAFGLGVELPIVRERDFRTTLFGFPFVITQPAYRTLLRVYSPDPIAGQKVRVVVRPFVMPTNSIAASYDLTLFAPDTSPTPMRPAFAQLDLAIAHAETGLRAVRVDVIPLETNGRTPRVWAFVTITNNETHAVSVMRP